MQQAKFTTLVLMLYSLFGSVVAGDEFECRWALGNIEIDGHANEDAWKIAEVIEGFVIPGTNGVKPLTSTRARLLWDRQFLYFFAELEDHDLFADIEEHDGKTWENDVFELFFKPSLDITGYYEFQVNAAGTTMDMFLADRSTGGYEKYKSADTFEWESKVRRVGTLNARQDRDEKWSVEGRFPWTDFLPTGGRPNVNEKWRFALCRYDYFFQQSPQLSSCAPLSKVDFHRTSDYAILKFRGPESASDAMQKLAIRKHHLDSAVTGSPEPLLPFRAVRAFPAMNLEWPVDVRVEPGTRRFVIIEEKGSYGPTLIKRSKDDAVSSDLDLICDPEGTAYCIAFHPRFSENGFMYIGSNGKSKNGKNHSRIVRHTLRREAPFEVIGDPLTILEWESNGHNGAAVTFGLDGKMYVTSGDGTSDSDTNLTGQDMTKLLAKVLRIDVDHPDEGKTYSVPPDNPFVGMTAIRPETWAYGLRNPWRITTDPKTGHIWVGNNGQDMFEQAYLVERGANYGWSVYEGSYPFYLQRTLGPTPHVKPTVEHPHSESRSLTGGVVYHGKSFPELEGAYIYGDYSTGKVWGVKHNGNQVLWNREIADTTLQISSITVDFEGEIILVDHRGDRSGALYHLERNTERITESKFPKRLSQTGLFASVKDHKPAEGAIPYSINAPFWSDGASKTRFMALPTDGRIGLVDKWAWEFPEATVLVKSFQLQMVEGDENSNRWIETRLLTKQQGEWVGYSYRWNEQQTDAELVESGGLDHEFSISRSASESTGPTRHIHRWRYPSRTECMVCHTRAARYVLGLSTHQMNKTHHYGDGMDVNQLDAIEAMGLFRVNWMEGKKKGSTHSQLEVRSHELLAKPTSDYPSIVNPYDKQEPLELRARSFLHANCAYCHVEAGGGNAKMDLSIYAKRDAMNIFDVVPSHHHFGKQDAKLIAIGRPDQSVLLHRIGIREPGQMPQLATSVVDQKAIRLLRDWIESLK